MENWREISGAFYDGDETGKPERPYRHDYAKTLTMKMFLSQPDGKGGSEVCLRFDEALDVIKEIDQITREIPKIIYLTGWQYLGHDDKYPSWSEVNENLKCKKCNHKTAAECLCWLMEEAAHFHTTVSLHINSTDAYDNSPLWKEYVEKDIISKKNGNLLRVGEYNGRTAYQINYKNEWESGCYKKRVDELLAMLPVEKAGTIHSDAFFCRASDQSTLEEEQAARRKMIRYWRERGVDLTSEFLYSSDGVLEENYNGTGTGLIGLMPMVWHFNQEDAYYMKRPASLVTGGGINPHVSCGEEEKNIEFLFGRSMWGENLLTRPGTHGVIPGWKQAFVDEFCQSTLPWAYMNQFQRLEYSGSGNNRKVVYENNLVASLADQSICKDGKLLRTGDDIWMPAIWKEREIIAYSKKGYTEREWELPEGWENVEKVRLLSVYGKGDRREEGTVCCVDGKLTLTLTPGEMLAIVPEECGKKEPVQIPVHHIPFSRYGAYLAISQNEGEEDLILHDVRKSFGEDQIYRLRFVGEDAKKTVVTAHPDCITVQKGSGRARLFLPDAETLAIESEGLSLELEQTNEYGYGVEEEPLYHLINIHHHLYTTVYVQVGEGKLAGPMRMVNDAEWADVQQNLTLTCKNGRLLAAIHVGEQEKRKFAPIEPKKEREKIQCEWEGFLKDLPGGEKREYETLTWYNIWSSFVQKGGHYHQDTVVMAKKSMCAVWSWDHCFNALSLAQAGRREEAWNQFMAPFTLQAPNGCLPDMWRPNEAITWTITKPPIHGWCLGKLLDLMELTKNQLETAYQGLEKWTDWWLTYRDYDGDGIPAYPMGCDCGWDNSSAFDIGYFVESPDLPAYLILQMETLARVADALSDETEEKDFWEEKSRMWTERKNQMKEDFLAHCWEEDRFVTKKNGSHIFVKDQSLLNLMPLVLGEELDREKQMLLIRRLKQEFLTEYGLATESPESKKYNPDGYWRGPIWAPVTYLLVDGLYRGGESELASEIAHKFCCMLEKRAGGNYENFDAKTGKGLRAPGYTWTASVYLLLYWEFEKKETRGLEHGLSEN